MGLSGCARAPPPPHHTRTHPHTHTHPPPTPRFPCSGFPRGCPDSGPDALPWSREGAAEAGGLDTKYPYVVHAECNAILNKNSSSVKGARMYVGLFPCNECAKMIIQSGIKEVVFMSDKYSSEPSNIASRRMFDLSGVRYRKHAPVTERITLGLGGK